MAACGRSDEDRTTNIKEEVGSRRGNVVHLLCATWLHCSRSSILQRIGRPEYFMMNSSIIESSLLRKCNY